MGRRTSSQDKTAAIVVVSIVVLVVGIIVYCVTYRKDVGGEVKDRWWTHTVEAQEIRTFIEKGTRLPSGARELRRWSESYQCGSVSVGEGISIPTYCDETHYEYEIDRWTTYQTYIAKGDHEVELHWPDYTLNEGDRELRHTKYGVQVHCNDEFIRTWEPSKGLWDVAEYGKSVELTLNIKGSVTKGVFK